MTEHKSFTSISVVICTYNRCASLRQTLEGFCTLVVPQGLLWELLVMDNNSTDATKEVCNEFTNQLPLRYVFESRQGKSNALNRSIEESKGQILLFTDDDVDVDTNWLKIYAEAAALHPEASFFGGKVLARWDTPPPQWIADNLDSVLIIPYVDKGESVRLLENDSPDFVIGANIGFRRSVFQDGLRFPQDVGPSGSDTTIGGNLRGEEIGLQVKLRKTNQVGLYFPKAIVYHRNPAHRMTERYLRRFFMGFGVAQVRQGNMGTDSKQLLRVPRYLWRVLLVNAMKYALNRPASASRDWLDAEKSMAQAWGAICEFRRLSTNK